MPRYFLSGISRTFVRVSQSLRQVTYVLLTRSPLGIATSLDLHVLGTPPAFILSQDQTLKFYFLVHSYFWFLKFLTLLLFCVFLYTLFSSQRSVRMFRLHVTCFVSLALTLLLVNNIFS